MDSLSGGRHDEMLKLVLAAVVVEALVRQGSVSGHVEVVQGAD
jgi:hypothetical protein